MAIYPDWVLLHPLLRDWRNRVDWTAYMVAADQVEEEGATGHTAGTEAVKIAAEMRHAGAVLRVFTQGVTAIEPVDLEAVRCPLHNDDSIPGKLYVFRGYPKTIRVDFYPRRPMPGVGEFFIKIIFSRSCLANPRYLTRRVLQEFLPQHAPPLPASG